MMPSEPVRELAVLGRRRLHRAAYRMGLTPKRVESKPAHQCAARRRWKWR